MSRIDIAGEFGVKGKVALVTGGSKGIGFSICEYFAAAGAAVALVARGKEDLDAAVNSLKASGAKVLGIQGDVLDPEVRETSCKRCLKELGGLDILVNNAGSMGPVGKLVDLPEAELKDVTYMDQLNPLLWAQSAWRAWMSDHGGSIINISSFAALRPRPPYGGYGSAKAALDHMTRIMALELAPKVRVNSVAPGLILTAMAKANATQALWDLALTRPMKRHGEPEDIARAVLFLASEASSWITGQVLPVEGGALLTS